MVLLKSLKVHIIHHLLSSLTDNSCTTSCRLKVKVAQLCRLFVTPWTVARQAPLSMGFSRQGHWARLPCPPPGGLADPGMEPASLTFAALAGFLAPPGKPFRSSLGL